MKLSLHPKIDSFLADYVDRKTLDKGITIYKNDGAKLKSIDRSGDGIAVYKVKSDSSYENYSVEILRFKGKKKIQVHCDCPYWRGACKHIVAALLEMDATGMMQETQQVHSMLDSPALLPDLSDGYLKFQVDPAHWRLRNSMPAAVIFSALNGIAECSFKSGKESFTLRFTRAKEEMVQTACSCAQEMAYPLCLHKLGALLTLRKQFGIHAFEAMRDWTEEKNKMLAPYGFSLEDDLKSKFDFTINDLGKLEMTVLDTSLRSMDALSGWLSGTQALFNESPALSQNNAIPKEKDIDNVLVFAFSKAPENSLTDVTITPLAARYQASKNKLSNVKRLEQSIDSYNSDFPDITLEDSALIRIAKNRFQYYTIVEALKAQGISLQRGGYSWNSNYSEEGIRAARIYIGKAWADVFPLLKDKIAVLSESQYHYVNSMSRIEVCPNPARVELQVYEKGDQVTLECFVLLDGVQVPLEKTKRYGFWLFLFGSQMFRFAEWKDAELSKEFEGTGKISVRAARTASFLANFVMPLMRNFSIDLNIDRPVEYHPLKYTGLRLYLKEDEANMLFVPVFGYQTDGSEGETEEMEFGPAERTGKVSYTDGKIMIWQRDVEAEAQGRVFLENLHPDFPAQAGESLFYLPFPEVLKEKWLYRFFEETAAHGITVFGFAELKNFKYNPNRPAFKIRTSSGIDWFDMKMEISFGDQLVSLNDIKKALVKKQNYVQLADGTIGILPEEWLEKHASVFKLGQVKDDTVQISKLHFSLIDDLYEHIDNEKVQQEIREKKMKLLGFKEIKDIQLPRNMRAQLRDYQMEGIKWLKFLEEFNWGGCLADDMGLGKTVQVLTFLQMRKETNLQAVSLVVVPTTLIFNWQAEVQKFAPEMRVFVHRGIGRDKNTDGFRHFDIVLTTYGTLRSDIEQLKAFDFDYIILDESQAIKNPNALVSKAVKLLRAQNRIVMTGTPVENNTFDLYSQMDFVNPGLLGGQDFFRTEFATPIDKHRDEKAAQSLRKLIHPFILKRTKDEVAKDLPDKTEMTLFCEMGKKQRKVYETYREVYRQKIADKMTTDGKDKAAFLILEGLLKLRQICDSPALLSDDADYGDESAKLDEIIREIEENAGHHKILIFSQFLKMLDLIKNHLEKTGIPYEYLDGSTRDRASRVRNFQDTEHCRVFLMSLKAGGVGINLTEADYVYLIDPWWNPAVEQQAIDRTHRIGQTKKVFAYKMICKDTIEEKILQLQDRKKGIAKELISTEQGFIKKLTKEDVMGLFS